jgi:hypothetical protein
MADKLAWFFEVQGILVSLLFLGANYYMWLGIQRIENGRRFLSYFRTTFAVIFVGTAIWVTPQNFLPDLTTQAVGVDLQAIAIPERAAFMGLMMAKGLAVTSIIIMTFISYLLYRRAILTGRITWGAIDSKAQYALIFLPAVAVYTMGLMGAVRELARQDFLVHGLVQDTSPYWYIPTLGYTSLVVGVNTLIFFALMVFIFFVGFKMGKEG